MTDTEQTTAQSKYTKLSTERETYLARARECAKYTIPFLIPPSGASYATNYQTPWQSLGSRGVSNLAAKLTLSLFPPNTPFFRFVPKRLVIKQAQQSEEGQNILTKIETALVEVERALQEDIETSGDRIVIEEAMLHSVVAGNALLYVGRDGTRMFPLHRYVVRRDPMGHVLEVITHESISLAVLEPELQALLSSDDRADDTSKTINLYTHVQRTSKNWTVYQELNGIRVPDSNGTYPLEKTPWLPLRFTRVDGEDYGRSFVEKYLGDLISLEGLTQTLIEGTAAAAKLLFLVNPNGLTDQRTLATAPNGAIRSGNATDVTVVQSNKSADFQMVYQMIGHLTERLSFAFLLNTAIQRQAERVTAEEIRYMAEELESSLGGIYSILSAELQQPYIKRKMVNAKNLPSLPPKTVSPEIVTGLEALGRGNDRNKLVGFLKAIGESLGPEAVMANINVGEAIARLAQADGIDPMGLVKSSDQLAQEQKAAQQQQQASQVMTPMINQAGSVAGKAIQAGIDPAALAQGAMQ